MRTANLFLVGALTGLAFTAAAQAADTDAGPAPGPTPTDNELAEVVVTGTRLQPSGFSTPTPVTVVTAEQMQRLGITNVADELNTLPSFAPITTPASNLYFTNTNIGANILDLRGLGAQRTLVLVDGLRFVPSNSQGTVDINAIPSALIDRTEVVTGGASAAYGADAVAGVVNIILKKELEGFDFQTSYGRAQAGDDGQTNVSAAWGSTFGDNRGHFMVGGEYEDDRGTGSCYARSWCYRNINVLSNPTPGVNGYPANVLSENQFSTLPTTSLIMTGPLAGTTFAPSGTPVPWTYGKLPGALLQIGGSNENGQQSWYNSYWMEVPVSRDSILGRVEYQFNDHISGFFEASHSSVTGHSEDYPYLDIYTQISSDNPYIPASLLPALTASGTTSFLINRQDNDLGFQYATSENATSRFVAGLEGDLPLGLKWDTSFQYGRNSDSLTIANDGILANHALALDAVTGPNGQIVCRSTLTNPNNGCVPLDIFGYGQSSPLAVQYVNGTAWQSLSLDQYVAVANLRGNLFNTWAGPVSAAVGYEYREDKAHGSADPISEALGFENSTAAQIAGELRVNEGYLETEIPLLHELPFAKSWVLNGAVRETNYNLSGNATTWKVGTVYEPDQNWLFRVTESQDIRAPNIQELFAPPSNGLANIVDPTTGAQNLVPYVQKGNPNLQPEKARTFTAGVVLNPKAGPLEGLRLSLDYYDIKVDGAIDTIDAQSLVTACYNGSAEACSSVERTASGALAQVTLGDLNLDRVQTEGLELAEDYQLPLEKVWSSGRGKLDLSLNANHVTSLTTTYYDGISVNWAGNPGTPTTGPNLEGVPNYAFTSVLTYSLGAGSMSLQGRFVNGGTYDARLIGPGQPGYSPLLPNSITDNHVPSAFYMRLAAKYDFALPGGGQLELFGAIGNILNRQPPAEPESYLVYYYDVVGRTFSAGVRLRY